MAPDMPAGRAVRVTPAGTRPPPQVRYLPIAEHGLIGDLHTAAVSTDYLTRIAGCKYRNLAGPGPERQNGRVYSADFFEDRWRRYPHPSLSRGRWSAAGFGSSRS